VQHISKMFYNNYLWRP